VASRRRIEREAVVASECDEEQDRVSLADIAGVFTGPRKETATLKLKRRSRAILWMVFAAVVMLGGAANAKDRAYRVIHNFRGWRLGDGCEPIGVPAAAKNGDLYGVTYLCGTYEYDGIVFKLTAPSTRDGVWRESILYNFPGGDGGEQPSSLVLGADGNLYGVDFSQTIFELKRPASHNAVWTYAALYTLNQGSDGAGIENLVIDASGNLYGATGAGGDPSCNNGYGCGTVFELQRPTQEGGQWVYSVLYAFTGTPDGEIPYAGVTFDQKGNLYGTTNYGGSIGYGAVYRVSPPTQKGGPWTETVVYSFDRGTNMGSNPEGPVTFDQSSNLYGTTAFGGDLNCQAGYGCGVVFELSPQAGGTWAYTNLYSFQGGNDGLVPTGYIVIDRKGSLYSTTQLGGGGSNAGIAFKLSPPVQQGDPWTETVLHSFKAPDDSGDNGGLIWGKWGDLYGVTYLGGARGCQREGCGTVFELQP
jgi:uncharacterized repeat protein (TIGR03803 family)